MSRRKMSEVFAQDRYGNGDEMPDEQLNPWDDLTFSEDPGRLVDKLPMVEGRYGIGMSDRNIMHPDYLSEEERRKQMEDI